MIRTLILYLATSVSACACEAEGARLVPKVDGAPEAFVRVDAAQLSQPFSLRVTVCGPRMPSDLQVDAVMPAHQHGMNYTPVVTKLGDGTFDVQGMLFHMPGHWEVRFDIKFGDQSFPYSHRIVLG